MVFSLFLSLFLSLSLSLSVSVSLPPSLFNLFVYRISWRGLYFPRLVPSRTPGNINRADKQRLQRIFDTRCCAAMRPIVRLFETANLRKKTWRLRLCLTWKRLRRYWRAYCGLRCNFAASISAMDWYNSCGVRLVKSTDGMMKGQLYSILANLATRRTVHIHSPTRKLHQTRHRAASRPVSNAA